MNVPAAADVKYRIVHFFAPRLAVALHEQAYATMRERTRPPARLVTLGLRDHASRQGSERPVTNLPLDGRLYAIKSPTHLSLATVEGRRLIPYSVAGCRTGWPDHA